MGGAAIGVLALWTEIILNESRVVGGVGGAGGWGAQDGTVGIRGFGGAGGGGAAGNGGPAIGVALASAGFSGQGDYYYPVPPDPRADRGPAGTVRIARGLRRPEPAAQTGQPPLRQS